MKLEILIFIKKNIELSNAGKYKMKIIIDIQL